MDHYAYGFIILQMVSCYNIENLTISEHENFLFWLGRRSICWYRKVRFYSTDVF